MKHGANCGSTWTKDRQELNVASKKIRKLRTGKQEEEAKKLKDGTNEIKKRQAAMEAEEQEAKVKLEAKLMTIGNILHESVPVSETTRPTMFSCVDLERGGWVENS
jgi:seryl-tRNA synthetase